MTVLAGGERERVFCYNAGWDVSVAGPVAWAGAAAAGRGGNRAAGRRTSAAEPRSCWNTSVQVLQESQVTRPTRADPSVHRRSARVLSSAGASNCRMGRSGRPAVMQRCRVAREAEPRWCWSLRSAGWRPGCCSRRRRVRDQRVESLHHGGDRQVRIGKLHLTQGVGGREAARAKARQPVVGLVDRSLQGTRVAFPAGLSGGADPPRLDPHACHGDNQV